MEGEFQCHVIFRVEVSAEEHLLHTGTASHDRH